MNRVNLWAAVRTLHYKANSKRYPQVNIKDVSLEKKRFGFRKDREPLLSQSVTDTLFPSEVIREKYRAAGKPVPIKYRSRSDEIARRNFDKYQDEVATGEAHFKVGNKEVYFPGARICLLRPNAKHTPYQAKFLVPMSFNKMDLRDYLWHVYGLRALNVTVQLLHGKFTRGPDDYARYRQPQFKKMTVDMAEPFVWPEVPASVVEEAQADFDNEYATVEARQGLGSDRNKPLTSFDGMYKQPELPDAFVSERLRKEGERRVQEVKAKQDIKNDRELAAKFLETN